MNHLFVPYELAIKLKEKGFTEPCLSYYQPNIEGLVNQFYVSGDQPEVYEDTEHIITLAPLYQQVVNWLEEKHRLWMYIVPYGDGTSWSFSGVNNIDDKNMYTRTDWEVREKYRDVKFSSRFIATNIAIIEALKLIDEVSVSPEKEEPIMFDWNKLSLDELCKYLEDKYMFSSTGDAKAIHHLIEFYKQNKNK